MSQALKISLGVLASIDLFMHLLLIWIPFFLISALVYTNIRGIHILDASCTNSAMNLVSTMFLAATWVTLKLFGIVDWMENAITRIFEEKW